MVRSRRRRYDCGMAGGVALLLYNLRVMRMQSLRLGVGMIGLRWIADITLGEPLCLDLHEKRLWE